jgi:hypothetical protein
MKRLAISLAIAGLAALAVVATVFAAGPAPTATPAADQVRARDTISGVLGLSQAQVMDLRHDGLTLAQIAERQQVDPQVLVDALTVRWTEQIQERVTNGALSAADAATLRAQVAVQAKAMVNQAAMGGMRGAAVGAGPGAAAGNRGVAPGNGGAGQGMGFRNGSSAGNGLCDGSGPNGNGAR